MEEAGVLVLAAGLPYLEAIRSFRAVVDSCFGMTLDPTFATKINLFGMCTESHFLA